MSAPERSAGRFGTLLMRHVVTIALVGLLLPLQPAAQAIESDTGVDQMLSGTEYVQDEILVVMEDDVDVAQSARSFSVFALDDEEAREQAEEAVAEDAPVVVKLDADTTVEEALEQAADDPNIKWAQPNYIYHLMDTASSGAVDDGQAAQALDGSTARLVPDDPAVTTTTPSKPNADAWHLDSINAFEAWDMVTCDNAVTVAVLDTGCRLDHEDLKDQIWQEYAWNSYLNGKLTRDYAGHGTHVCGLAAAQANNGIGIAGSSYNARVLPVCVFDTSGESAMTSTLVDAYEYILDLNETDPNLNLHVVNMSLGGYGTTGQDDRMLMDQIARAKEQNIVTICAGGNGDEYGNPITANSWPADYPDCVAVTALDTNDTSPSTWCDYNTAKDICAPGVDLYSTYYTSSTAYTFMSGTSMASPIAAGAFALLWKAVPDLTVDEALEAVYDTAGELTVPAGREGRYGHGKLDIAAALRSLSGVYITSKGLTVSCGGSLQMECTIAGDVIGTPQLTWSIANGTGVATIDATSGLITALLPGTVDVTVTCTVDSSEIGSDTCTVTVQPLSIEESPLAQTARDAIRLSWDATDGAIGYRIERSLAQDGAYEEIADVNKTSFEDVTVPEGVSAFYRVAPYSDVDYKVQTGVFTQPVKGVRFPLVTPLDPSGASASSEMLRFLEANGASFSSVVLVSEDDPLMMIEATSLAGAVDGIVLPVGDPDAYSSRSTDFASLARLGVQTVIVLGGESAVGSARVLEIANQLDAAVVRYGDDSSSANDIALELITNYADLWSGRALIMEPSAAQRASDIASYAFAMHMPVLFTAEGGASLPASALVAAKRLSNATVYGDTDSVKRSLEAVLALQGVQTNRWVPDDKVSIEAANQCVEAGSLSWDFVAYFQRDEHAVAAMAASVMGQVHGIALPAGSGQDDTESLAATRANADAIACAFVLGEEDFCVEMTPLVSASISGERADSRIVVDEDQLDLLADNEGRVSLSFSGDGALHLSSSNESVATARYDADAQQVVVNAHGAGRATIVLTADDGIFTNAPEPVNISVAVARVDFLGASLRDDSVNGTDYAKTAMRFGYAVDLPDCELGDDGVTWKWSYGMTADALELTREGELFVADGQGTSQTNLVFANIGSASYACPLYAQLELSVTDDDGVKHVFSDIVRERSVQTVAEPILASSGSSAGERSYASALLGAM